jgi:nucleoside-diphosphate-sugar epimerase
MNKTIAITGATGFIGQAICRYLRACDYSVIELVRKPLNVQQRFFDLTQPVDEQLLDGVEVLVHCAFMANDVQHNYEGTKALRQAARRCGVGQCIFFSSVSAHASATSLYGKGKLRVEGLFGGDSDVILRPGLVLGAGGLFGEMLRFALQKRVVPLVNGGRQPMQVVGLEAVTESVRQVIENKMRGTYVLANEEQLTYRQFFETIEKVFATRLRYVWVPAGLLKIAIGLASFCKIKLPVTKENLRGLQSMRRMEGEKIFLKSGSQSKRLEDILLFVKQQYSS